MVAIQKPDQMQTFISKANAINPKYGVLLSIGFETGLRVSDILPLSIKRCLQQSITIKEQKTGKRRVIRLSADLRQQIKTYAYAHNLPNSAYVIPSTFKRHFKPLSRMQCYRVIKSIAKGLKIDSVGTHSMRKTFAIQHYRQHHDLPLLQSVLNHEYLSTTLLYLIDALM